MPFIKDNIYILNSDAETPLHLAIEKNGAGTMTILGKAKSAEFTWNGAGKLVASDFKVNSVSITTNGANQALVYAIDELIATLNGVGKIDYLGNTKSVIPTVNGLGKVHKR